MTKQRQPKRHHHLPQATVLNHFTDSDGYIFMYDNKKRKISYPRKPESVGFQNHLYTVHYDKHKDTALEKKFARIEDKLLPSIHKVLSLKGEALSEDIRNFIQFIALLIVRSPRCVEIAQSKADSQDIISKLRKHGQDKKLPENEVEAYINKVQNDKGYSYSQTVDTLWEDMYKKLSDNYDVILYFANTNVETFLISDNYMVLESDNSNIEVLFAISAGRSDYWNMNLPIYCPIASKACFAFIPKPLERKGKNQFFYKVENITQKDISKINKLTFSQFKRYLYSSSCDALKKWCCS